MTVKLKVHKLLCACHLSNTPPIMGFTPNRETVTLSDKENETDALTPPFIFNVCREGVDGQMGGGEAGEGYRKEVFFPPIFDGLFVFVSG